MKNTILILIVFAFLACKNEPKIKSNIETKNENVEIETGKIRVLNFGTMHLSGSTDAYSSQTNSNNPEVKADLEKVIKMLVDFKPTVICLEIPSESNAYIMETYTKYKTDQTNKLNWSEEVNVLGLEVARLSGTERIYGIDSPTDFNWTRLAELANKKESDSLYFKQVMDGYEKLYKQTLLDQFKEMNKESYKAETFNLYNFLATTDTKNYESAKIVANFYERNLKIFANFSDIPLTENDRVLILMGATHTAYLDIFIENSPLYKLENTATYTNY